MAQKCIDAYKNPAKSLYVPLDIVEEWVSKNCKSFYKFQTNFFDSA